MSEEKTEKCLRQVDFSNFIVSNNPQPMPPRQETLVFEYRIS
jgi:hypothetical protein